MKRKTGGTLQDGWMAVYSEDGKTACAVRTLDGMRVLPYYHQLVAKEEADVQGDICEIVGGPCKAWLGFHAVTLKEVLEDICEPFNEEKVWAMLDDAIARIA